MPSSRASDDRRQREVQAEQPPAGGAERPASEAERPPEHDDELARMEDRYKRALADLDNYRKRSARELERRVEAERDQLLLQWLEVIDGVERALRQRPHTPLYEGLRAVLDQMDAILARQGVRRTGEAGEPFDPERHEAIDVRTDEGVPDRTVVEVARSGFAVGDRVLRPAQVVVSRSPARET